jgi:hypothetical protein
MLKNTQTAQIEASEAQTVEVETPESELGCSVELLVAALYNGHSYVCGTIIGNVPLAIARKMESFHTARIIGSPARLNSLRPVRDPNAIENQLPSGLDPSQWEAVHTVPGRRSTTFINTKELEALQNRR